MVSSGVGTAKRSLCAVLRDGYGGRYSFIDQETPPIPCGSALVRIEYSGLCHGDVYTRDGGGPAPKVARRPLTGGHEGAGVIVAINETDTEPTSLGVGHRVGIAWRNSVCGECEACVSDAENFCSAQRVNGLHIDGTFQEYVVHPVKELVPIPVGMPLDEACTVLCAGVTSYSALKALDPQPGSWCVISGGAGAVGHFAIQFAKQVFGLKVLAIDADSNERKSFCLSLGADAYVDFYRAGDALAEEVKSKTSGGAHYTVIFSPAQTAYTLAGDYTRFGGTIMAVGIGNCHMPLRPILTKKLIIRSNQTGTRQDMTEALEICAAGRVKGSFEHVAFRDLDKGLDKLAHTQILGKLVLQLEPRNS